MKREEAQQVLMSTLSLSEQMLIEEIETLPERLIDAMIKFNENQGQELPINSVSRQRELLIKFLDWQYSDADIKDGDMMMVDTFLKEINL